MALMECSLCRKTAEARQMQHCSTCRAPLCPKCAFVNLGLCTECISDEEAVSSEPLFLRDPDP